MEISYRFLPPFFRLGADSIRAIGCLRSAGDREGERDTLEQKNPLGSRGMREGVPPPHQHTRRGKRLLGLKIGKAEEGGRKRRPFSIRRDLLAYSGHVHRQRSFRRFVHFLKNHIKKQGHYCRVPNFKIEMCSPRRRKTYFMLNPGIALSVTGFLSFVPDAFPSILEMG